MDANSEQKNPSSEALERELKDLDRELEEFATGVRTYRHMIKFNAKETLTYLLTYLVSLGQQNNNITEEKTTCYPNKSTNKNIQRLTIITEEKESNFLDPSAPTFIPTPSPPSPINICSLRICVRVQENNQREKPKRSKCKTLFTPIFPARAQYNIYIAKDLTCGLLNNIHETFPSSSALYYYIDITTALQINDSQMSIFTINNDEIVFVNYDLHLSKTQDILYGVIRENKGHKIKQDKWIWKLCSFMTANEIFKNFGVCYTELPSSSRRMNKFQNQLEMQRKLCICENIVDSTDWNNIKQIKSVKRGKNNYKIDIVVKLNKKMWIQQCKKSWFLYPNIPTVHFENKNKNNKNTHWIEWIKLIRINDDNECMQMIGVSCRYLEEKNKWIITAINLDKGDILNKHRLVGWNSNYKQTYGEYFDFFNTTFTKIEWIKRYLNLPLLFFTNFHFNHIY